MGRRYAFLCPKCSYLIRVSGGEDGGAHCFTRTIHCLDCHDLFDAVTHVRRLRGAAPGMIQGLTLGQRAAQARPAYPLPAHAGFSGIVLHVDCVLPEKLLPAGRRSRWTEFKVQCPRSPLHRIEPWSHPGACPHCRTFLERTVVPSLIWE